MDDNGHGTHTASTAVGTQYGIAKASTIIAVKVLGANGSGAYSDIIAGIEWVMNTAAASGRPSVANMSLGGPARASLDQAVKNAIKSGVHFAVAAGNAATDADDTSPARGKNSFPIIQTTPDISLKQFRKPIPLVQSTERMRCKHGLSRPWLGLTTR